MSPDLLRAAAEGRYVLSESERAGCDALALLALRHADRAHREAGVDPNYARQERWREAEAEHRAEAAIYRSALAGDTARREREAAALRAEYERGQRDEREAMQAQLDTMAANALRGREASDAALARAVETARADERNRLLADLDARADALRREALAARDEGDEATEAQCNEGAVVLLETCNAIRARGAKGGE